MSNLSNKKVPPLGNPNAPILFIGEAPGYEEDKEGEPFVGKIGEFLWFAADQVGIEKKDCFVTNVLNYRPRDNNFDYAEGTPQLKEGIAELKAHLANSRHKLIISFGAKPLEYILGSKANISSIRGYHWITSGQNTLITYHPSYVERLPEEYPVFIHDLKKAKEILLHGIPEVKTETIVIQNDLQAEIALDEIDSCEWVSVDIENVPETFKLLCIGVGVSATKAYCFPGVSERIYNRLANSPAKKIFQNGIHDVLLLHHNGFEFQNAYDTHISESVLNPELPRSLDHLASVYTWLPYWKDKAKQNLFQYNAMDCIATYQIWLKQLEEYEERPHIRSYFDYRMDLFSTAQEISRTGVLIDLERRELLRKACIKEKFELNSIIRTIRGTHLNVEAKATVAKYLYDDLKLPVRRDRKTSKRTTKDDALVSLIGVVEGKIRESVKEVTKDAWRRKLMVLKSIRKVRTLNKLHSTYIDVVTHADNRARGNFKPGATETGRWSCDKYPDDTGFNLQTLARDDFEIDETTL